MTRRAKLTRHQLPKVAYHIAGPSYTEGEDLHSWNQLEAMGLVSRASWRWEHEPEDDMGAEGISIWLTATDALEWIEDGFAPDDYQIVKITGLDELDAYDFIDNKRQIWAIRDGIDARHLTIITQKTLEKRAKAEQESR